MKTLLLHDLTEKSGYPNSNEPDFALLDDNDPNFGFDFNSNNGLMDLNTLNAPLDAIDPSLVPDIEGQPALLLVLVHLLILKASLPLS